MKKRCRWYIALSGNYGNTIDGQTLPDEAPEEVRKNGENPFIHPLTPPVKPVTNDRQYYHIPWEDSKPCTHIKFTWQDHRRRLYNSNVLLKICERLVCDLKYNLLHSESGTQTKLVPECAGETLVMANVPELLHCIVYCNYINISDFFQVALTANNEVLATFHSERGLPFCSKLEQWCNNS